MDTTQATGSASFSTGRIFHVMGSGWYFDAREGMHGPYPSREMAVEKLEILKRIGPRRSEIWDDRIRSGRMER